MAAASESHTEIDEELLHCSICLEIFTGPKYLPCLHTFCESCLTSYITSSKTGQGSDNACFSCPVCRATVSSPGTDVPAEKWGSLLPNNNFIISLLERNAKIKKGTSIIRKCDPCKVSNDDTEAKHWCVECVEALCETCGSYHQKMKQLKHHQLVSILEIDEDPTKIADIEEPCSEHKGKILEVYCVNHGQLCCVLCLATKHRECKNIETLDEAAAKMTADSRSEKFTKDLKGIAVKCNNAVESKQMNLEMLDKQHADICKKVGNQVENVKKKLDTCYEKFTSDFKQLHKVQKTKLLDKKANFENFQKTVANGINMLRAATQQGSAKQALIIMEKVKAQLAKQLEQIRDFSNDHSIDFELVMSETYLQRNLTTLGEVKCLPVPSNEIQTVIGDVENICSISSSGCIIVKDPLYSADIENVIAVLDVQIISKGSDLISGALLDDGRIILSDYNQRKVHLYDNNGQFVSDCKLDCRPFDVAAVSVDTILVSPYETLSEKPLQQFKITSNNQFCKLADLQNHKTGRGLSATKDFIVRADRNFLSLHSNIKNTVFTLSRTYGNADTFVCMSKEEIYYIDGTSVVCCSTSGEKIFQCQHAAFKDAMGIAVDIAGNVYVSIPSQNTIRLISKDRSKNIVFMNQFQDLNKPFGIGFSKDAKRLFVTSDSDKVYIYKLKMKK